MTCYIEATLTNNMSLLNAKNLVPFITSMLTLTLVTNVTTTCKHFSYVLCKSVLTKHR